ncbi:flavodoxin [Tritrichomonas foetus]|uniref:Flavodoxin n=1 Tax=Tritrichomonas foetus TaxID=1144522 RepID=A0A1J4JK93_9EUKA|nr:flavodoxin [Tritrichomonas foetus]|eukprot:OHS99550.1 flavodoxin [Tritrichomonas foetus]
MTFFKILILYFSRSGYNYYNGRIVHLDVGNTKANALILQNITKGDICEVVPVNPYPVQYQECTEIAKIEKEQNSRPEYRISCTNVTSYDLIFLGHPIWWGTFPMVVHKFLEDYDLGHKNIAHFVTHEGSGFGTSQTDLRNKLPNAKYVSGINTRGGQVNTSISSFEAWVSAIFRELNVTNNNDGIGNNDGNNDEENGNGNVNPNKSLKPGEIAGIVVGCAAFVVIVIMVIVFVVLRKKKQNVTTE